MANILRPEPGSQFVRYQGTNGSPRESYHSIYKPPRYHRGHKGLYAFLILILLLAGGGYYCYKNYFEPGIALPKAIGSYTKADLVRSDVNLSVSSEKGRFATSTAVMISTLDRTSTSSKDSNIQIDLDIDSEGKKAVAEIRRVGENVYVFISKLDIDRLNPLGLALKKWNFLSGEESLALYSPFLFDPEPLVKNGVSSIGEAYARLHVRGALKDIRLIGAGLVHGRPVARYKADVDPSILASLIGNGAERWTFSPVSISTDVLDGSLKQISAEFWMNIVTVNGPDRVKVSAVMTYDGSAESKVEVPNSQNPPFMI